jgi:hypothetical protein
MNRRGFFGALFGTLAAAAAAPAIAKAGLGAAKFPLKLLYSSVEVPLDYGMATRYIRNYDLGADKWITRMDVTSGWAPAGNLIEPGDVLTFGRSFKARGLKLVAA